MYPFILSALLFNPAEHFFCEIILFPTVAALALPHYQDYIAKTQTTRVVGELAAAKDFIDAALFDGNKPILEMSGSEKEEALGMVDDNKNPRSSLLQEIELVGDIQNGGNGGIQGTMGKKTYKPLYGVRVGQYRSEKTKKWRCFIDPSKSSKFKGKYLPYGCEIKNDLENLKYDW